jgi:hypothetical protein
MSRVHRSREKELDVSEMLANIHDSQCHEHLSIESMVESEEFRLTHYDTKCDNNTESCGIIY